MTRASVMFPAGKKSKCQNNKRRQARLYDARDKRTPQSVPQTRIRKTDCPTAEQSGAEEPLRLFSSYYLVWYDIKKERRIWTDE